MASRFRRWPLDDAAGATVGVHHDVADEQVGAHFGEDGFDEPAGGGGELEDLGAARVSCAELVVAFAIDRVELRADDVEGAGAVRPASRIQTRTRWPAVAVSGR